MVSSKSTDESCTSDMSGWLKVKLPQSIELSEDILSSHKVRLKCSKVNQLDSDSSKRII